MDYNFIIIFFVCSVINVFLQTAKSLIMIRTTNKHINAITQAIVYAFYTIVIVFTAQDVALWLKCVICGVSNLIGTELTYIVVNPIMDRMKKEKLWKIEVSVPRENTPELIDTINELNLQYNWFEIDNYILFGFYCYTRQESEIVKNLVKKYNGKYFITEMNGEF